MSASAALLALLALVMAAPQSQGDRAADESADDSAFIETELRVPRAGVVLALRDMNGDGRVDLLWLDNQGVTVRLMGADGRYAEVSEGGLAWPAGRVAWDIMDLDGDGRSELGLLVGGKLVRVYTVNAEGRFDEGLDVLEAVSYLPAGITRMHFARDVDGDGRSDLVLPGIGKHQIFLRRGDGWADPIQVAYEADVHYRVGDPQRLDSEFGQEVHVPSFRLEDVDGDGVRDLVSETSDRVAFHLAHPELSSSPTWVLDLEQLRGELPQKGGIDLENLWSMMDQEVRWFLADLDGKEPRDLIVSLGPKLRIYLGGAATGPSGTPDQVLKSSGNVLWTFVRQVEGDPLPELQLVRAERIGIGRVLRYLILPGALHFDLFTYRNQGGTFSRRPTRRNRVTFEIPRILSFIDEKDGLEAKIEDQFHILARRLAIDASAPAAGDDVIDLLNGALVLYEGCAPAPSFEEDLLDGDFDLGKFMDGFLLDDLDARGDGAQRTIDLGDLETYDFAPGAVMRRAYGERKPIDRHPLPEGHDHKLSTRDLNGDGRSDVIVVAEDDGQWIVHFLVRR